jgi:uncharacterized membrane protein
MRHRKVRHPLFLAFGAALGVATPFTCYTFGPARGLLAGFDLAVLLFVALSIRSMRGASVEAMRARAERNDAGRAWLIAITAFVLGVVLVAVTAETGAAGGPVATKLLPLGSLALAWVFSNLVFALHYAQLYYRRRGTGDAGGLELPGGGPMAYVDFCYFAFVVGMTFQVSDIQITDRDIRRVCLVHALIAFFFNVGVVALSVNIIANAG